MFVLLMGNASMGWTQEKPIVLEVWAFEGGYGVEWLHETAQQFEALYPDVDVQVVTDPRIWEKVAPRFVAGDPPDVVAPGWKFDHWGAILEGQIMPLTAELEGASFDGQVPWIETFEPGTFAAATYNGEIWYIPLFPIRYGWWYNETVWQQHRWEPPETWDEAYDLFEKMKNVGVAPIANQGIYPDYLAYFYVPEFVARIAGPQKYEACVNLEPNSWTDPDVVAAFDFLNSLISNYFQEGHIGMTHLQAQAEVMVGRAGMVGCGSWFPKEMEQVWPEGHEVRAAPLPPFEGVPYPQKVYVSDHDSALLFVVPSAAQHKELAVEFLKLLTSEQISKYTVQVTGSPTTYKDSAQWVPDDKFGRAVKSCWEYYEAAAYTIAYRETIEMWYPKLHATLRDWLGKMQAGQATPEEVAAAVQRTADALREDPTTILHRYSLVEATNKE